MHGAGTAAAKAKAAENVAAAALDAVAARVRAEVASLGVQLDAGPPAAVIMDAIRWSAGHVAFFRGQVRALAPALLVQGTRGVQRTERTGFEPFVQTVTEVGPDVNIWWRLYSEERDRLHRFCVDAERLKIDTARVEIEKAQGARVAEGFLWVQRAAALRWGLAAGQVEEFRGMLRDVLGWLASGEPFPDPVTVAGEVVPAAITP
jgi:hypothetical protein